MKQVIFIGDHHGKWDEFWDAIVVKNVRDAAVFQLGDGGFGFAPRKVMYDILVKYNDLLAKRNIILYNIRGNHDNPVWFQSKAKMVKFLQDEDKAQPTWTKDDMYYIIYYMNPARYTDLVHALTNIKFVPDYTVINEGGYNILCIGGAISVDRMLRVYKKRHWFKNERITYRPTVLKKLRGIDIVATHNTPQFAYPQHIGGLVTEFGKHDKTLYADVVAERELMTKIYNDIVKNNKPKFWYYGHYHKFWREYIDDIGFTCLMPNQLHEVPVIE